MDVSRKVLSDVILHMKYARYMPDKKRRETWEEIIARNMSMHIEKFPHLEAEILDAYSLVLDRKILPSMRTMQFAGRPIALNASRGYNCAYMPIDSVDAFAETMFLLLGGTGVGYSVQKHHIEKLPPLRGPIRAEEDGGKNKRYLINDSLEGWAETVKILMESYFFAKKDVDFDYRDIRPKGAQLVTAGGKAPGPQPLKDCVHNIRKVLDNALQERGRNCRLTSLEVHDILCHIADAVLSGGIRRCLPKGAMVHTEGGMVPIQEVTVGTSVLTCNGFQPVRAKYVQGEQETIIIKTVDGSFECTPNHRMAVLKGIDKIEWVEAANLKEGDRLVATNESVPGERVPELPSYEYIHPEYSTTCKDITIPSFDEDIAWFLGTLHANGYVYYRADKNGANSYVSFVFALDKLPLAERVQLIISRFGLAPKLMKRKGENSYIVQVQSKQFAMYLHTHFKQANTTLTVPSFIWTAPVAYRLAYVAGIMDSDGCASNRPVKILSTVYESFAEELQNLLYSCGIQTRLDYSLTNNERRNALGWKPLFGLSAVSMKAVNTIVENPNFMRKPKLRNGAKRGSRFPSEWVIEKGVSPKIKTIMGAYHNKHITVETYSKYVSPVKYIPVEVIGLEKGRVVETYDLEVETNHDFFCNGYLTHNSAMISFFSYDDDEMLNCKNGAYWETNSQRGRANNSVVLLRHKLTKEAFDKIWERVKQSGSGEPGIYLTNDKNMLGNPCNEASLHENTFCNLVTILVSDIVTQEEFNVRCKAAALISTLQASTTDFHYLREAWRRNTERDALLGISMTGIATKEFLDAVNLTEGAEIVLAENERVAKLIKINKAARTTLVKPDGTSSLLLGCSSGIHAWYDQYYIRRIRVGKNEAIYTYFKVNNPELLEEDQIAKDTAIIVLPIKAPDGAITRNESAGDALERVKKIYNEWIVPGHRKGSNTHNSSVTINIKPDEWDTVKDWMWENRQHYNGISVLPYDNGVYIQAPFESITKERYDELMKKVHDIDLSQVWEAHDDTNLAGEIACGGGACEIR